MTRAMFSVPVDDFITPAADDATLRVAQLFTKHGVRGCFHVVGEVARVLRARGRRDVVEALAPHEIGYHSNLHSIAPLPIETMETADWRTGVEQFLADESAGARDVADMFGRRPVYYVHAMAVAPQTIYAARLLGMRAVGTGGVQAWRVMRFCGNLIVNFDVGFDPPKTPDDGLNQAIAGRVDDAVARFVELAEGRDPRYPIRLFTHANKYISWQNADGVNFVHAATPPRDKWKLPPTRGEAASEKLYAQLDELLRRVTDIPGVEFVTYGDVIDELGPRPHWAPRDDILKMADGIGPGLSPQTVDGEPLTCAEQFALLCRAVASPSPSLFVRRVIGPVDDIAETAEAAAIPRDAFIAACRRADQQMDDQDAVPGVIEHQGRRFGPGSWMRAMASALRSGADPVTVAPGDEHPALVHEPYFQTQTVGWRMYPESFTGENICRARRRQSWSAAPVGAPRSWQT